jgi:large subunit ribosomal protein L10
MKREIPEKKLNEVKELKKLAESKRTIMIASIKNLPSSQFQSIVKKLRGKAIVKVPKKSIILRAIDSEGKPEIQKLKEKVDSDIAILFSDLEGYELAAELVNNKSPSKGKIGQEAPEDIVVDEGPTDLIPGPAVSELGALGIQITIENGKINIKKSHIIVKKGKKISEGAAALMNKLDIKPFLIGFEPLVVFDTKEGKLYDNIKIDREQTVKDLKEAFGRALPFAVELGYTNEDTIKFIIGKAGRHSKAIEKLFGVEKETKPEEPVEEKTEDTQPEIKVEEENK